MGKKIRHKWEEKDHTERTYVGEVLKVLKGQDGCVGSLYEVKYEGDEELYEIDIVEEMKERNLVVLF